ncbi:MAG TPA: hypothetical protein VMI75_39635 [Polyangiaceae bacterium]|nr:hypothetical protein [Polyangiaceae bacterium]
MTNLKLSLRHFDDGDITRPMPYRKAILEPLPRFSMMSVDLDGDAITRPMPPGRRWLSRLIPRMQRVRRWSRWPIAFYGMSAGVLVGALLWFAVTPFGSAEGNDDGALVRRAMHVRRTLPAGSSEEPPPMMRAEDLPIVSHVERVGRFE